MALSRASGSRADSMRWLCALVTFAVLVRLVAVAVFDHVPQSDELAYLSMARSLVDGEGIRDNMGNAAMYNVGYPVAVLSPVILAFGEKLWVARSVHALLGGLSVALCYALARELGAQQRTARIAGLLWAVYIPSVAYSTYLYKEHLMIPVLTALVWRAAVLSRRPSFHVSMQCGFLVGVLALTGSSGIAVVPAVLVAAWASGQGLMKRVQLSCTVLCVALIVVSPWAVRNLFVLGAPVLNTNGGFNLYLGNNPSATGRFVSISETPMGKQWHELREVGEVHASAVLKRKAIEWIVSEPVSFAQLAIRKVAYFWSPPAHNGSNATSMTEAAVRWLWVLQFLAITVGAIIMVIGPRSFRKPITVCVISVVAYTALHSFFYVIPRYRLPIMPVLCVLASFTVGYICRKFPSSVRPRHRDYWQSA